jgi:diguanylate cyclase (GGDEF)-like protein
MRLATVPACLALAACALLAPHALHAQCLDTSDPEGPRLRQLAERDSREALRQVQQATAKQLAAARPDGRMLALLYAAQAYADEMLELDAEAREASAQGLRWTNTPTDPSYLNLVMMGAENVYDRQGLERAQAQVERVRATVQPGSQADVCLLITLGRVQARADRTDLAIQSLTRAYTESVRRGYPRQRVLAAGALAPAMRQANDFAQAESLTQEQIDWDKAHGLTLDLSVARYQRGVLLVDMHRYPEAIAELKEARALSVQLEDRVGVAFTDMHLCNAEIGDKSWDAARRHCQDALKVFQAHHSTDVIKQTSAQLARLDLEEGHAASALATLDRVLDQGGNDITPHQVVPMYQLRARAEAALGDYKAAFRDLNEYLRLFGQANESERRRQETLLRTRFDADREIQRNTSLQRELALERERADHQRLQLRSVAALGAAGAIVILLLGYIVLSTQQHRRRLQRLAGEDALTRLPNRRNTIQLAEATLSAATRSGRVVTVALIDLDHFKLINDQCGHAEGDRVLQEFARIARLQLRASDVLGRWGGEEFLLVMSECTLDQGLATLERVRGAAARIAVAGPAPDERRVTLSAGLATNEDGANALDVIVARADAALYEAKHGGRDLVRIAEESYRTASTGVRRALGSVAAGRAASG